MLTAAVEGAVRKAARTVKAAPLDQAPVRGAEARAARKAGKADAAAETATLKAAEKAARQETKAQMRAEKVEAKAERAEARAERIADRKERKADAADAVPANTKPATETSPPRNEASQKPETPAVQKPAPAQSNRPAPQAPVQAAPQAPAAALVQANVETAALQTKADDLDAMRDRAMQLQRAIRTSQMLSRLNEKSAALALFIDAAEKSDFVASAYRQMSDADPAYSTAA